MKGQQYAQKNNLPILHNTTLPRVGALNGIRDVLIDSSAAGVGNALEINGKDGCKLILEKKGIIFRQSRRSNFYSPFQTLNLPMKFQWSQKLSSST